jgi:hypothetical protein
MTHENQQPHTIEVPKPGFQEIELFGGFESDLRDNADKLAAYQVERSALAEQGHPTFIVHAFFEDGYDMSYLVSGAHVANIHYCTDEEVGTILHWVGDGKTEQVSLEEALLAVKAVGYVEKSA